MTDDVSRKRKKDGYEPCFDIELEYGAQGEAYVMDVIEALKTQSIEVKRDGQWARYGNLYVERRCLKLSGWTDSGINTSEALVWGYVLGDTEVAIFVPRGLLMEYCRELYDVSYVNRDGRKVYPHRRAEKDGSHPTKGVTVPIGGYDGPNREWFGFLGWLAKRQKAMDRGGA